MSVTPESISEFVCWLAAPPWQTDKLAIGINLHPTKEQVTLLYGARKALMIMEKLASNSDARTEEIEACTALFDRMLGQCAYGNQPKPDAEVDIAREDLPTLGRAATYLIEFMLRKRMEAEAEKRQQANRGQYRGRK